MTQPMTPARIKARVDLTRAQIEYIVAEVSSDVHVRMQRRMDVARDCARTMREMAPMLSEIMKVSYAEVATGPEFSLLVCAVHALAVTVGPFELTFRSFVAEHGAVLEQEVQDQISSFCRWAVEQPAKLAPYWSQYMRELEAGIEESAAEQAELTRDWSSVDGDGLFDA